MSHFTESENSRLLCPNEMEKLNLA